jgi:ubiquinone/menaquinone biosynthesis C-methylase UbiE
MIMDEEIRQRLARYYRSSEGYKKHLEDREIEAATFYTTWVSDFVPKGAKLLDLGCGTGASSIMLSSKDYKVFGLDLSKLFIDQERKSAASFLVGDALELPFASSEFDAVSSAALLEHLPDAAQALEEMLRVLKKGGYLLILAPNPCSLTMPISDWVRLSLGKTGRPYFAEDKEQAIGWLFKNLKLNAMKILTREVRFHYVVPDLSVESGGDHDMVYYASPLDVRRFLRKNGARIVSWSGVRFRFPFRNGRFSFRGMRLRTSLAQNLFWPFAGTQFVVARKS